jgi:hypothetical protein
MPEAPSATKVKKFYSKHPSPVLTSPESLAYTRKKDRDFTEGDMGPKLVITPKKPRGRVKKPIPFRLPKPSLVVARPHDQLLCATCKQPAGSDLANNKWLACAFCKVLTHLECIAVGGQECNVCSQPIYIKKEPRVPKGALKFER